MTKPKVADSKPTRDVGVVHVLARKHPAGMIVIEYKWPGTSADLTFGLEHKFNRVSDAVVALAKEFKDNGMTGTIKVKKDSSVVR